MNMKMKKKPEVTLPPTDPAVPTGSEAGGVQMQPPTDPRNVVVSHGVHYGRYPVGGMMIRDARRVLSNLMHIDAEAVAVIGGRPVDETTVIGDDISHLSFVKPSALKG